MCVYEEDMSESKWTGLDWLCAVSVYSRFQKAASYGELYKCVYMCACVHVYLCLYCI